MDTDHPAGGGVPNRGTHPPIVRRVVAVARVPRPRHPVAGDVAQVRKRPVGVARVPVVRESTRRILPPPPSVPPVFVDDTGRRRRLVGVVASSTVVLVLALVAFFWFSQAIRL